MLEAYQEHYYKAFAGAKVSLLRPATTSLIVSPEYKISDMGIVDVLRQKLVPLFPGPKSREKPGREDVG
jgi:adenine deaminase